MAVKIKNVKIKNFKPFKDFSAEFDSQNIVVFDGPNGFGKTSFYDALELLFTGTLRRYKALIDSTLDKRQSMDGSPLLNHKSKEGDLVIQAELDINGQSLFLMRKENREYLVKQQPLNEIRLPLYTMEKMDDPQPTLEADEDKYLSYYLGDNYIKNFEFLHYIEQEENIYLLKSSDKNRQEAIAHLFNTSEHERRLALIKEVGKKIGELCGKEAKSNLEILERKLKETEALYKETKNAAFYQRLINWSDIPWDAEDITAPETQYIEWLKEDGTLSRLNQLILNKKEFKKLIYNNKLDSYLKEPNFIANFLLCWNYLDQEERLNSDLLIDSQMRSFVSAIGGNILEEVGRNGLEIPSEIKKILESVIDIVEYQMICEDLKKEKNKATALSSLLINFEESRNSFIEKFNVCKNHLYKEDICPMCGHVWEDGQSFLSALEKQENIIKSLIGISGADLSILLEKLKINFLTKIEVGLREFLFKNPIDANFISHVKKSLKNRHAFEVFINFLDSQNIDIRQYCNVSATMPEKLPTQEIITQLTQKRVPVNSVVLREYFEAMFIQYFEGNIDHLESLDITSFADKRKYIEARYAILQSEIINTLKKKVEAEGEKLNTAIAIKKSLDDLKKIYEAALIDYQKGFIENVEILLHIYYGRIAQQSAGGLGIFIESDKKGIRFLENLEKNHDAVFTMSSGQLATLIISFTLALNKRFSLNQLLFIDDPVQTMDELNIAGFVELLRNEFSDRHIFISTHEDRMSAYIRYKFKKFGLDASRLSFKEKQLAA